MWMSFLFALKGQKSIAVGATHGFRSVNMPDPDRVALVFHIAIIKYTASPDSTTLYREAREGCS